MIARRKAPSSYDERFMDTMASEYLERTPWTERFPECRFEVADATALPFADASFEKAVAADFVEHIRDDVFLAMCSELRRVLVPGGTFAVYAPNPRHLIERMKERDFVLPQKPTHIGLRDVDHMTRVLEQGGFRVLRSEWRPSFFRGLRAVEKVAGPRLEPCFATASACSRRACSDRPTAASGCT